MAVEKSTICDDVLSYINQVQTYNNGDMNREIALPTILMTLCTEPYIYVCCL